MPDYDVCVIGSGAGGGVAAWALSKAGFKVLVLEKGPFHKPKDLMHDEIRDMRSDFFVPHWFDEPNLLKERGDKGFKKTRLLWTGCCVGGGTTRMSGLIYRLWPQDFRMKTLFGNPEGASVVDWPISYDDLEPYYTRIESIIGVSGLSGQYPFEPRRSKPYPMPPTMAHPFAAQLDESARGLGLHPFPTPRAAITRPYRGRPACIYHAACGGRGCPVGAKSGTLASVLPEALRTGKCAIIAGAMVYRLETDSENTVKRAVYFDSGGKSVSVSARCFVAAGSAIQTARLLLNSKSGRFPRGLCNNNGLVGRNLSFSVSAAIFARYKKEKKNGVDTASKAPFLQRSLQDFYVIDDFKTRGLAYPKGGTLNFILGTGAPVDLAERFLGAAAPGDVSWGEGLKGQVLNRLKQSLFLKMEVFQEFLPSPKTYADVYEKVKDKWGIPVARARVFQHPTANAMSEYLVGKGMEIVGKTGPVEASSVTNESTTYHLQQGTCRFGDDPSSSVLDPDCRAHEVGNLYVADGSFMPTSGGVPSTFTIMANSLRVSDKITEAFRQNKL